MRSSQIDAYHKIDNNAINLITRFRKIDVWVLFRSSTMVLYHLSQILFIHEMSEAQSSQLHYSDCKK